MSLQEDQQRASLKRKSADEFSDQVLYEQAILIASIVGIAITLLWSSVGRVEYEPFSVLYLVPDSYSNFVSEDMITFRYGVQCFEDGPTGYILKFYLNDENVGRKEFKLNREQT
ncbi:MAG: hypothetical protein ABH950_01180, partial [Candidatus Altiarchaeota archaeon]